MVGVSDAYWAARGAAGMDGDLTWVETNSAAPFAAPGRRPWVSEPDLAVYARTSDEGREEYVVTRTAGETTIQYLLDGAPVIGLVVLHEPRAAEGLAGQVERWREQGYALVAGSELG